MNYELLNLWKNSISNDQKLLFNLSANVFSIGDKWSWFDRSTKERFCESKSGGQWSHTDKSRTESVVILIIKTLINLIMSKHVPLAGGRYSRIMGLLSLGGRINNNVILLNFNNFCFHWKREFKLYEGSTNNLA